MTRPGENGRGDHRRSRSRSPQDRKKRRSKSRDRDRDRGSERSSGKTSFRISGGGSSSSSSSASRNRKAERERDRSDREQRDWERDRELERERNREAERKREREREREKLREQATKYAQSVSSSGTGSSSGSGGFRQSKFDQKPPGFVEKEVKKPPKEEPKEEKESFDLAGPMDKEEEQRRLEQEMIKRRERIERWRAERKRKEVEIKKPGGGSGINVPKKWSLEDDEEDDDDDGEGKGSANDGEDDVDPLDAFMKEVNEEVRKVNKITGPAPKAAEGKAATSSGVTIITGVAKKNTETVKKGELIEQNQDGLEYSSEEEQEDIKDTAANLANKQKKELAKIDHSGINYLPFRKVFYVEVPEIAKMTQTEVDAYKAELEGINVKGKGCPKPIRTWAHCGVTRKEFEVLRKLGFEKPTPIQCQAIPAVMSGRDLIGIAKTGSGKTLAFILPMFRHVLDQPPLEEAEGPIAIIMSPTRELCMQIGKDIKKFAKSLNLRAVCVYGGTGISEQIAELKRGAEIIVCTPGRMIDMLAANSGRVTNLRRVTYVVLDEADRMFDMGFEPQVMRIIDNIRPDRQTVMFSATFPRQMEALARRILKKPVEIQVGGRSVVCKEVEQHVVVLEEDAKFFKLLELLGLYQELGSIIVFVDKQENADILLKDLMKASYPCMSLHGGIDQFDRDSTIIDFKQGRVKLLIATSVAARGLDVKQLILVVNYDCPNHYEDYVHRCGRTGRAGNKGFAWTFLTHEQGRYSGDIIRALELSGGTIPDDLRQLWETYKTTQEEQGKKVHTGGGFSGKGFKFDEQEAAAVNERKKMQKAALGLQDSDDDEDLEQDIDQHIESMFATKRIVKEVEAPVITQTVTVPTPPVATNSDKLELAKRLASRINLQKSLGFEAKGVTQQAAEAILKGSSTQQLITAKTVAEQLAAKLNTKLNYQPKDEEEAPVETNEQVFRKYEEELEINDFPQQARWKVTSKEALAQISEYSEAGLTVRGTYVPPGKNPPEGERKLYLAIESCSELAVTKAKREITRLIKEELLKLQASHHIVNKSRYKVI
ncbi:probable ATP-dependent RNA helicase DDX46 [Culex quinquefasciatus]|uniref:probable ATP-dependent RNA helicase DDX46 n=1 Tax=Culex quinquefasciatus TaxID=7176 RepID=UPI0018E32624|nr:probable ATP-dependent RNA helicase DDX46 [Culex quinquefasciatus]